MFMKQKSMFSGRWGRQSLGRVREGTYIPKCIDPRTSVRQDGYVQCWAIKLYLAFFFFFFKSNPNSCSESPMTKAVGGSHLGGRHTTNHPVKV